MIAAEVLWAFILTSLPLSLKRHSFENSHYSRCSAKKDFYKDVNVLDNVSCSVVSSIAI